MPDKMWKHRYARRRRCPLDDILAAVTILCLIFAIVQWNKSLKLKHDLIQLQQSFIVEQENLAKLQQRVYDLETERQSTIVRLEIP